MSLLLRHATLIDPAKGTRQVGDLLIREGRIVQAGTSLSPVSYTHLYSNPSSGRGSPGS